MHNSCTHTHRTADDIGILQVSYKITKAESFVYNKILLIGNRCESCLLWIKIVQSMFPQQSVYQPTIPVIFIYDGHKNFTAINCCKTCTNIILRLSMKAGFQYLLSGINYKQFAYQRYITSIRNSTDITWISKVKNFSYVSYSIRVNQSSLKYLNLFQENMPFSDIQVSGCFYTFWLLLHISTSETAEILVSTMHYRSQQTSTLSGKPAMAWKNIKECSLNYDRTTHNPHKLVFLCTFLAHPRRQLPIP